MSASVQPAPPPPPPPLHEARNPYVGPRAFEIGETLYGRDREIDDLFDLLVARRIVLLYAPSGAGKSSLVQAGLIPRLRAERFADLPVIRVNLEPPAGAPAANRYIASVTAALAPAASGAAPSLEACLAERERSLAARSPVLIFDQFEELFTTDPTDPEKKQAFFTQVGAALQNTNRWALFVMREEFVGALEPYARFMPTRLAAALRLDLLGIAAAREAIQRPAGSVITDGAVDALIEDLRVVRVQQADGSVASRPGPYIEPSQLQVVCYRLWERPRADPAHITPGDVAAAAAGHGAVDAALAGYYADQLSAVAARFGTSERAIRDWFDRRLITPQGVRALVLREPDEAATADGRIPNAVIRALVDAHLVRAEERRGVTWFELAHDRLIEPVRQDNRTWKEAHLNALQRGAEAWDRQSRLDGLLLSGAALGEAKAWAEAHPGDVTAVEHEYLNQSRRAEELVTATLESNYKQLQVDAAQRIAESERAGRRRQTVLSIALGVLALLALAAFGYSLLITAEASHQRDVALQAEAEAANQRAAAVGASAEAQAQRDAALKANADAQAQRDAAQKANAAAQAQSRLALARELAANASLQLGSDPELSTLLALESLGITYTPEADSVAWQAANQWHQRLLLLSDAPLDHALYSPDGKRVLAFGQQTTASGGVANPVVWDAESGKELFRLAGHKLQINDAAWSPNGQRIATASADNTAIIWDAASGRPLATLAGSRVDMTRVVWSRDSTQVATADADGVIRIFKATGGAAAYQMTQKGKVLDMDWAPGDRYLATTGEDRLLHIWDPATGRQVRVMSGHAAAVRRVAWNAAGNLIATSDGDGSARIWNLDVQTAVAVLPERGGSITDVAWHPKDNVLATSNADGAVSLWRAPAGGLLREFGARRGPVASIAFAPDGKRLATVEDDNTARVWDVDTGAEIIDLSGHATTVTGAMFSPDGQSLLTSSADHTARIWRVERPQRVNAPLNGTPTALAWSADGRFVAVALGDKVVLWNVAANVAEGDLSHEFPVEAVAFSPDGKLLATGSGTCCDITLGTVTVWSVSDRAELWSESEHAHIVESVAWSPDGRRVVSGSRDETARIWDAASGKQLMQIKSGNPLKAVAWSRDGRFIAGMQANAVRLWDAQNGQLARTLAGGNAGARQIAFSPDSRLILVPADGRAARVYDVATGERRWEVFMDDDVHSVAWSPKGSQIATGGADGTVRLWDAANGVPQRNLLGYRLDVIGIIYSPDGVRLATVNDDGSLRFFLANVDDVIAYARSRVTRQLTCAEKVKFLHADLTCPK